MKRQEQVTEALERETLTALDKIRKDGLTQVRKFWEITKRRLAENISSEYRNDFKGDRWDVTMATRRGTLMRISHGNKALLESFRAASLKVAAQTFRKVYRESVLRHAWILDTTTPPNMTVRLPQSKMFTEATPTVYKGPEAENAWKVRWSSWTESYDSALTQNLKLGAINGSDVSDAVAEVDATRAGTPGYGLWDALERVYTSQGYAVQAMGAMDVSEANGDMGVVEIWQTRYNARVCDDCDANAGLERDEAEGDIPFHPNCNCYWRLVPMEWAELLRSGDEIDNELARRMDAKGMVPSSMVIMGKDGKLQGVAMVSFKEWLDDQPLVIGGE